MNIWKKMTCILDNQEIPDYLKREEKKNNSDGLHRRCAKSITRYDKYENVFLGFVYLALIILIKCKY